MFRYNKSIVSFLALFYLSIASLIGQSSSPGSYQQRYEQAKSLYEQGDYQQAIEIFQPISRAERSNPYAPYASYFYAMSALQTGDANLAKNMFLQIKNKYPRWRSMSDVNYGLVNAYYELGNYEQAFAVSNSLITDGNMDSSLQDELKAMKSYYLAREPDEVLEDLLLKFPEEKAVAEQLVTNITYSIYNEERQRKKDSLVEFYSIDLSQLGVASQAASIRKDEYHIAAFLPFFRDKLTSSLTDNRLGNQFILELYRGMKLAADDLKEEGINVNLHAYDTQREYDVTKDLLDQDEIKFMDVFVGPLYQGPVKAVSEYSRENQVYMFNPLSANPQIIGENPFSYLIKPSSVTEAKQAARYALDSLDATQAVVVTGPSKRDSARVMTFIQEFQAAYDQEVHLEVIDDYNEETMELFVEKLQELHDLGETVVYVASDQELVITNTISAVVMSALPLKVIGNDSWFNFTTIAYEQLEEIGAYLLSPIFLDYNDPRVQDFRERYRQEFYSSPTKNVFVGYDAVYFLGQMLDQFGVYFQEFFVTEQPVPSAFFQGYNYFQANDNQVVPILYFEEGSLKLSSVIE